MDHGQSFDIDEVFGIKLEFLTDCRRLPTVETGHVEQHAQLSVLPDELFKFRREPLIIRLGQNPGDVNRWKIPAVVFIYVNRHF